MNKLFDELKLDEGFRSHEYLDTEGVLTIGYGYNLEENELNLSPEYIHEIRTTGITIEDAELLLLRCIDQHTIECARAFPWFSKLCKVRQEVLINMSFNMGMTKLRGFINALRFASIGEYNDSADELLDSKWARQVGHRAQRLAQQMRTGKYV